MSKMAMAFTQALYQMKIRSYFPGGAKQSQNLKLNYWVHFPGGVKQSESMKLTYWGYFPER
jgi:hypothetical protein